MIATNAPTPGTVISRRQIASSRTMRQHRPVQGVVLGPQRLARPQHRLDHPLQHRLAGDQLADPGREPALADLADLQPEAAQDAADAQLDVQQLALQELAPDQQRPDLLRRRRLAVHRPEPAHPQQLGDAARVLAVGLDHHRRERRLHVPGLEQHRLEARPRSGRHAAIATAARPPARSGSPPRRARAKKPTSASGSLATLASRTIRPVASTTHTLLCSSDTSIPA